MHPDAPAFGMRPHRLAQRRVFLRVQLGKVETVALAQKMRRNHWRAGIGGCPVGGPGLGNRLCQRMILRQQSVIQKAADACLGLSRLDRLRRVQLIEPAPRVGLQIAERLILLGEIGQHPRQQRVFLNVRQISGVIDMLI